jgi:hypothetical protein
MRQSPLPAGQLLVGWSDKRKPPEREMHEVSRRSCGFFVIATLPLAAFSIYQYRRHHGASRRVTFDCNPRLVEPMNAVAKNLSESSIGGAIE